MSSSVMTATPSSMMMGDSSNKASHPNATALLALFREDDLSLQKYALETILYHCLDDGQWSMIVSILPDLEALAESTVDTKGISPDQIQLTQLAAAVASKVFFYLEEPASALRLALLAGSYCQPLLESAEVSLPAAPPKLATIEASSAATVDPYVTTLVRAALDSYVQARQKEWDREQRDVSAPAAMEEDAALQLTVPQLQPLIDQIIESSCLKQQYQPAIGLCFEARDIAKLQHVLQHALTNVSEGIPMIRTILQYTLQLSMDTMDDRLFARLVMTSLATFWQNLFSTATPEVKLTIAYDLIHSLQCLNDATPVATVLKELIQTDATASGDMVDAQHLTALQIVFDLTDTGDQAFCQRVADALSPYRPPTEGGEEDIWERVFRVLTGGFVAELALSFRHKHSGADHATMESLKRTMEDRSSGANRASILHTNAIVAHSYLYAGTTYDAFLRNNLDWMKKASHWAKFTATASLGVIHADHITEAMTLLEPYLPANPDEGGTVSSTGGYSEGGSLYALGLIHGSSGASNAEKRREAAEFVRKHLRASHANEAIAHGACLAVGLTCMGSADATVVQELKEVLDTDFAVTGEAAGIAIGMVLVGTGAGNIHNALPENSREELMDIVAELKNYARETQHEKIIRGIAMGLAVMNFGQEFNADATIEEMRTDRDPIMRYGAQYAIALAYCGTGSNKAIRILLHTAVSDVSDDVRMAAVISLAFVLFKTPDRVPQLVKLLLESFNPHVRYASCMAVGIAMAGTGDSDSVALLEPMLEDMTDYVRQGALIGTAMIYMQQSDSANGRKIRSFRDKLSTFISEKHQSALTKMGAILGTGILDAGGRNCALQLGSRNGFTKMTSAVGLVLWLQHWHWFPMLHMFSLALTPTLTIGLNKNLKYPKKFEIICRAKPSQFAFPKKLQEKKEKEKKRVETVTLSTTAKEKARLARKKAKKDEETMDEGEEVKPVDDDVIAEVNNESMDIDKEEEEEKPKKKREPEPNDFTIQNPARVTKEQSQYCEFDLNQRYRPIRRDEKPYGVVMLTDSTPEEEEYIGAVISPSLEPLGELPPPEPFEWTPPPLPTAEDDKIDEDKVDDATKESSD